MSHHPLLARHARRLKLAWGGLWLVALGLALQPVSTGLMRAGSVAVAAALWAGALLWWWPRKGVRAALIGGALLPLALLLGPGRPADEEALRAAYLEQLRSFELWWFDASAKALGEQYRGFTAEIGQVDSLNQAPPDLLMPGDVAVTRSGVHTMAYLGDGVWIEADPGELRVLVLRAPSPNPWMGVPMRLVRWSRWAKTRPHPRCACRLRCPSPGDPERGDPPLQAVEGHGSGWALQGATIRRGPIAYDAIGPLSFSHLCSGPCSALSPRWLPRR